MNDFVTHADGSRTPLPVPTFTISGSQAAAALGLDPFKSAVRLWAELTGKVEPEAPGEWSQWGTLLELVVREEVERREEAMILSPYMANQPDEFRTGFLVGHPDAYVVKPRKAVYEGKTTGHWRREEWADGAVPPQYVIQAHVYMHLLDWNATLFACLIAGQRLVTRWIERDAKIETLMLAGLEDFYRRLVHDDPPPPDGSESSTELLKALYPNANSGLTIIGTADDYATVRELVKVKAQRKAVETEEARLENVIKQRMDEASSLVYEGQRIASWPTIRGERKPTPGGLFEYRRLTVKGAT